MRRSARRREHREGMWRQRLRRLLALAVLGGLMFVAWAKLEWRRPTAEFLHPLAALGHEATIDVRLHDPQSGLLRSRIEIESAGRRIVLASEEYPPASWRKSTRLETIVAVPLNAREREIPEGGATIRVYAEDYSWVRWVRRERALLEQEVTIDLTPPTVEVLSQQHYVKVGGTELVLYKTSADAVQSGVEVGPYFFPGTFGLFVDPAIGAAIFAVPHDLDARSTPRAVAQDAAGNRRLVTFHTVVKPRRFPEKTLEIDDAFLERKVPEILAAAGRPPEPDLLQGYLYINRVLRQATEERVRELTRRSQREPQWEGALLRQPNSAPLSGFADRRSYVYRGAIIDTQTHLGFDLASLRQSPVLAASAGTVVAIGLLGIYGDSVILDHGLGLFTLYGHLSAVTVAVGEQVARGDSLGRTGETGLAGGDHLHFSVMLYGIHVDPVEWWDGKWIRDHVTAKLEAYPRASATARRDH